VDWTAADYAFFAVLSGAVGVLYAIAARRTTDRVYRSAATVALGTAFLLVWANGAVGIIGDEGNAANLMYLGVLAIALCGALLARLRPRGMARALYATALAQVLVAAVAIAGDLGAGGPVWPWDLVGATGLFGLLWLAAARLFERAARKPALPTDARGA